MKQHLINKIIGITILLIGLFALNVNSQIIPESDFPPMDSKFLVVDSAHVFSEAGRAALEAQLVAYDNAQSTQIAVVTINDLGPYEIAQYATEFAHHVGIGDKEKDNGILILFALKNRKVFIATGYGSEGAITDGIAGTIIRNEMIPFFKQQQYEAGLVKGAQAVMQYMDGEYVNDKPKEEKGFPVIGLIFLIFIIFLVIIFINRGGGGRGGGQYMSRRGSDFIDAMILGQMLGGGHRRGGGWGGGSGGFGGGSGGGFGGFGGGGFGGGGASGSW